MDKVKDDDKQGLDTIPRSVTTRSMQSRAAKWRRPDALPEVTPPPGYRLRWIRVAVYGQADPRNISSKLREGFEPVSLSEFPEFASFVDPSGRESDRIEIGGLLLCKWPIEFHDQRDAYYRGVTSQQTVSVENHYMRDADYDKMHRFSESGRTRVSRFGKGI